MTKRAIALDPIARSPLYRQVRDRLEELLHAGEWQAGDQLPPERELAAQLGVSRASLRQALAALDASGLVEIRHGSGTFLRDTRRDRVVDSLAAALIDQSRLLPEIMEARVALETELVRLAALRRTQDDLERAESALESMRADVAAGGLGEEGDRQFHTAIWDAARSSVMKALINEIEGGVRRLREESLSQPGRPPRSLRAHQRILDAVAAGDAEAATAAMHTHLREVADALLVSGSNAAFGRQVQPRDDEGDGLR